MTYVAPRTCTVVDDSQAPREARDRPTPLTSYANSAAYVLIAEPGAGKTTAFKAEAASQGGTYVTVRNFRTFDDRPEWKDTTLFLDGLDESRAGTTDGRTPLDEIRRKLSRLGYPPFRLSCRWADWMAATDKEALQDVSPDGTIAVIRLDPLSERNIKDILTNNHGVEDADGFIEAARKRGVIRLLSNPQNLDLLAKAVSQGSWPESRKETFDQACRMLVREPNGQHQTATPLSSEVSPLIEAAGRLFAVQLISGAAGFTFPGRAESDSDFPAYTDVYGGVWDVTARKVLGTRLFVGVSEGKLAPAHRQIAEFLAARYISGLLNEGLPLGRILALITGFDGALVPSFRNFASWLAVHSKDSRRRISQLDPSGMIYDGDRLTYSPDEKREIVRNLRREANWNPWCNRGMGRVAGFGGIVSPELEGTFREILADRKRDREHQSYVMLLMQMLSDGEALPALADVMEQVVRDGTWNMGVRCAALDVLTSYNDREGLGSQVLKKMLYDIGNGSLDDPHDELLGILLKALYPNVLSISEIQQYLRKPQLVDRTGEYSRFWMDHVPKESTPEQLGELLDCVAQRFEECRQFMVGEVGRNTRLGQLPLELLERALRETRWRNPGTHISVGRLYEWLGVVSDPGLPLPDWKKSSIRFDLEWNSDELKKLIAHGVETCLRRGSNCTGMVDRRLFGARPRDHGQWCLDMALSAEEGNTAAFYVQELASCVTHGIRSDGLTVEAAREALTANDSLLNQFDEIVSHRSLFKASMSGSTSSESPADMESPSDTPEQRALRARIATEAAELRVGRGTPELLHRAAEVYLGVHDNSSGKTPRQRLEDLVGRHDDLIDLLLAGMEGTTSRKDLPGSDDVVRLFDQHRVKLLVLPFVAGLHSLEHAGKLSDGLLTENQTRTAVAILYTIPQLFDLDGSVRTGMCRPGWFRTVLSDNPALVADILRHTTARKLETGVQQLMELHELANAEDHREVAALISLPLVEDFPKAETDMALQGLCWALNAALKSSDWLVLGRVIENRLGRGDLSNQERSSWLAAGYLVTPKRYEVELRALADDDDGLKALASFAGAGKFLREFTQHFDGDDIVTLVDALGAVLKRDGLQESAYWAMTNLIGTLGDDPSAAATEAIERLSRGSNAEPWEPNVAGIRERQAQKRREHEYRNSDIGEVVQALDGGRPANAGDLAALVFHELEGLSGKIRNGSASGWRQYWNVDGHNRPRKPRPENACRDAVLFDLQDRLGRLNIDAQPEAVYTGDNRSDMRVSFDGFSVPVEIKRSCHPEVWTAIRSQLIAKYTREPAAAGYGIYLVFWFGDSETCRPTKSGGWTPESAEDVRLRIEQSLDDSQGHLISVCVVDVSKPQ